MSGLLGLPADGDDFHWEPVTAFEAYLKKWSGDAQVGELVMSLGVDATSKYDALRVTDHPGSTLHLVAFVRVFDAVDP